MKVLLLGADGFIGRHIAFAFRAAGHEVVASARRPDRLAAVGFATVAADLTDPVTHDPAFWRPHLRGEVHMINAAGLLTGSAHAFEAVHVRAPAAALAAMDGGQALLLSAIGIEAATPFAHWRREGERVALAAGATVLRAGLVLADTSYGGSSALRASAALPFRRLVVGSGEERFNPIHAEDLARVILACLEAPPGPGPDGGAWEIGGPEALSQTELTAEIRRWLGLLPAPALRLPRPLARALGQVGDFVRLGPFSATTVDQLATGVLADPALLLSRIGVRPVPVSRFLNRRPAGTQDLWQARLCLMKPLIRLTLALMWLVSGLLGLFLPVAAFPAAILNLPEPLILAAARAGGLADLILAGLLIRDIAPRRTALAQLVMVLGYTVGLTLMAPALWIAPFGELLKNLPVMALILTHLALTEER
ncbi:SDR family oxidoreductase [Frigidibacter sp. RF13]|uniref:SDR family oxidoreductase n=1 Tax=Frigidibacter sp. RF13 TaxID=2997340 RepID=UPI00226FD436|nr:SDR family oxidoreductase [Frigidibacter sp. RF13]MCY1127039.1 SDR family oxidoreductase [Frigidibacter sp. RF13]